MAKFYLNKEEQDPKDATHKHEHELHRSGCRWFPKYYEVFDSKSSRDALLTARIWVAINKKDWYVDGCSECCPEIDSDK